MSETGPSALNARQHIEAELLEEVCRTRLAWREASGEEQEPARKRFRDALSALAAVVLSDDELGKG